MIFFFLEKLYPKRFEVIFGLDRRTREYFLARAALEDVMNVQGEPEVQDLRRNVIQPLSQRTRSKVLCIFSAVIRGADFRQHNYIDVSCEKTGSVHGVTELTRELA